VTEKQFAVYIHIYWIE